MSGEDAMPALAHLDRAASFLAPKVEGYLLRDQDEEIVDLVERHWVTRVWPGFRIVGAIGLLIAALIVGQTAGLVLITLSAVIALQAAYRLLDEHRQRFVITNMRVFLITGILSQKRATVPMARILDITVNKPLLGRFLDYGHFVFESAAHDQGLHDIKFVGRVDQRDLTIQGVIQRSGLRSAAPTQPAVSIDGTDAKDDPDA